MTSEFKLYVDIQNVISADSSSVPNKEKIELWVRQTLLQLREAESNREQQPDDEYEVTIRIVDKAEIQLLNKTYRHSDKATNVLSFPYEGFPIDAPVEIQLPLLGDIVICHEVVLEQAQQQNKTIEAHWAHMVIHGMLHLKAYDHIDDDEAQIMEALEVSILKKLSLSDPYNS